MAAGYILAIDQGTTSSRAILFDEALRPGAVGQQEFTQIFPHSGWVEHDPSELWTSTMAMCHQAIEKQGIRHADIAAIGITNQRETTLVWDRVSGQPVYNAIVWQDRRTADFCQKLRNDGVGQMVTDKTGLLLDPYFSATKLHWILENVEGVRARAERGELIFGTVDSYLIWKLTGGSSHVTDATNAARTMLYNIEQGCWDCDLLALFNIPLAMMPEVKDCAALFGHCAPEYFSGVGLPICGVAGDQQAATIGQACFKPGMIKSTYGTGCFALMNVGDKPVRSNNRLLATIAYQLDGKPVYALEGSIFIAGAVLQWLRDGLKIIDSAEQSDALAKSAPEDSDIVMVPAFTGLGAPYWEAECRGAIFGLTRDSGRAGFVRAALQSVAFQTRDLLEAMSSDAEGLATRILRVDGGMANSSWTMQAIADQLGAPVHRPKVTETTALGVAYLAARQTGLRGDLEDFAATWELAAEFTPQNNRKEADRLYQKWRDAIALLIGG